MTTYNSYEAAKIAMPQACICVYKNDGKDVFTGMPSREGTTLFNGAKFAEPADHCMTVERFLADGHKFVEGDLILDVSSVYLVSDCKTQKYWYETKSANEPDCDDGGRYVLRAAALKPRDNDYAMSVMEKKVKVEYEQLGFHKCHEAMFKHEMEEKLYRTSCDGFVIASMNDIADNWQSGLYRRIETEIEWYDDLVEFINQSTGDSRSASANRETLHVRASMSRDQWCDFARILLEQGE